MVDEDRGGVQVEGEKPGFILVHLRRKYGRERR